MFSKTAFLPRPDLTAHMARTIREHGLTVVTAPMGYGKTTLADSATEALGSRAYFYSTPAGPHDARFIWHNMNDHFESAGFGLASALRRLGFPETASQSRRIQELLLDLDGPTCLILDDYHQVTDPALSTFWEMVVKAEIPDLHLAIFSRSRPDMNLEELRIKRLAEFFDQSLLAFSETEAAAYFRLHGVLDESAAREAWRYSEGWAAALWLCLQSWRAGGTVSPAPDIKSLLAHTVFAAYNELERELLMRLSVPEHFTEDDAVKIAEATGAPARLRALREKNAFLTFDGRVGVYKFHGLFRDFLQAELETTTSLDKPSVYRQAGECCLARGEHVAALRLFARAGRYDDLRRLLDLFLLPEYEQDIIYFHKEIFEVISRIPWPVRLRNPLGYLAFVALCLVVWNDARAFPLLDEAEERFEAAPEIPAHLRKRLEGEFSVIRGLFAFNDAWALCEYYEEACRQLNGPSVILSKGTAWSFSCPSVSFIGLRDQGRYRDLLDIMEQNWYLCHKLTGGTTQKGEKVIRAEYLLELGDFSEAQIVARDVLAVCQDNRHMAAILAAAFCLARAAIALGRPGDAADILEQVRPRVERLGNHDHLECFDLAAGYVNAGLGRLEAIPQWLRDGEMFDSPHSLFPQLFGFSLTIYGKILILQGDFQRLAATAQDIPVSTAPLTCLFARIHSQILQAVAAGQTRGPEAALIFLREAVELSRPDGIILPLAEYGGPILEPLRLLQQSEPHDPYLKKVAALTESLARGFPAA